MRRIYDAFTSGQHLNHQQFHIREQKKSWITLATVFFFLSLLLKWEFIHNFRIATNESFFFSFSFLFSLIPCELMHNKIHTQKRLTLADVVTKKKKKIHARKAFSPIACVNICERRIQKLDRSEGIIISAFITKFIQKKIFFLLFSFFLCEPCDAASKAHCKKNHALIPLLHSNRKNTHSSHLRKLYGNFFFFGCYTFKFSF